MREAARAVRLARPLRLLQAGECEGFIPCPIHLVQRRLLRCKIFKLSAIKDSNNPLAAELESENDGCRTKIFLSVLSQFHFG
jgi:hypothetical protein